MNPLDENLLSKQNIANKQQYIHGVVDVTCDTFSVAIVFKVISEIVGYSMSDDTMIVSDVTQNNELII